ncbi:MAG: sulfatase [Pedosphaera sp.]|nr:sulfatase [Pedosphaera sp.]
MASSNLRATAAAAHPNILWITSEDHGPHMGCYGDGYATTPNVDKLAARGMIYSHVWSCAPVCAPSRTALISGMYPTSTGSEHMRSLVPYPAGKQMFPQLLREAGYYCSNNSKEDYNLAKPGTVWDDSSKRAHWTNRASNQPFFAVFNSEKSHESRIRVLPHEIIHDPAKVHVPAYHPDTPEVRRDWAQYYDIVSEADGDAGKVLEQLETDGLADDTIVFYYADHGSGMPRSKRWPYNSGLHVPLVVFIPEKFKELRPSDYRPGGKSDRLVSFVDFAPTVLNLAGVKPPEWMQGRAFLGRFIAPPPSFLHGFRGRMDERFDLVRSVTDGRHVYVRNYMPHLIYGQRIDYMFETPTTRVWKQLHDEGRLSPAQDSFWNPKPPEELYDLQSDPEEVNNLASSLSHQKIKTRLRNAQKDHALRILDVGLIPEGERFSLARGGSPYDLGHNHARYRFAQVFKIAELASTLNPDALPALKRAMKDADSAVRYWGTLGVLMSGRNGAEAALPELRTALRDPAPEVRMTAAQALGEFGSEADLKDVLPLLVALADWGKQNVFTVMAALNSLDALGTKAAPAADLIKSLPVNGAVPDTRYSSYVPKLVDSVLSRFNQSLPEPARP